MKKKSRLLLLLVTLASLFLFTSITSIITVIRRGQNEEKIPLALAPRHPGQLVLVHLFPLPPLQVPYIVDLDDILYFHVSLTLMLMTFCSKSLHDIDLEGISKFKVSMTLIAIDDIFQL